MHASVRPEEEGSTESGQAKSAHVEVALSSGIFSILPTLRVLKNVFSSLTITRFHLTYEHCEDN